MAGLHRTVASIRRAVASFVENPSPERAEVIRAMRNRESTWRAAETGFTAQQRACLAELLDGVSDRSQAA